MGDSHRAGRLLCVVDRREHVAGSAHRPPRGRVRRTPRHRIAGRRGGANAGRVAYLLRREQVTEIPRTERPAIENHYHVHYHAADGQQAPAIVRHYTEEDR